ncbi:MAG: SGNH/GDSL hydrolase family protein [Candidatus Omnitrophica bacterium]|nr:SGNH/GDSL hydrolase family protein [Candidatus Omnitrophota bacterium]
MKREKTKTKLVFIALLPVLGHILALAYSMVRYNYMPSGRIDWLVFAVLFIYVISILLASRNKERLIKLVLIVYSFIIASASIEVTSRFFHRKIETPWTQGKSIKYVEGKNIVATEPRVEFTTNRYGLRGPNIKLSVADLKFVTVGGSSTECRYISDEQSWPWKFQDDLAARLNKSIIVFNAGKGGLHALNHIYFLRHYSWIEEFDWVIVMCGINDMGRLLHGTYDDRTIYAFDDTLALVETKNRVYYKDSIIVQNIIFIYKNIFSHEIVIRDPKGFWYERERELRKVLLKRNPVDEIPRGMDKALDIYKDDLKEMISICRDRGQNILMITQPTLYGKDLPSELDGLIWEHVGRSGAYTTSVLESIMNRYNDSMIEVCIDEGVPYIDMASLLPKNTTVFYDDCHFNVSGCERVAKILSDYFRDIYGQISK